MAKDFLMGIDAGTSAVKTAIFDLDGNIISLSRRPVSIEIPRPGWAEQNMDSVWEAVRDTIREVLSKSRVSSSDIAGIGISGQGDGCRLIDKQLRPVRASILWIDGRTGEIVTRWQKDGVDSRGFKISGSAIFAGTAAAIIKWLEKNEPNNLKRSCHFLFAKDWIKLKLTGQISTDESDASRGPINLEKRCYSDKLFEIFEISPYRQIFPRILPSAELSGEITSQAAEETGLRKGTPVIAGMIDVVAMPIALGVVHHGQAYAIVGTTCFNAVLADQLILESKSVGMSLAYPLSGKFIRAMPSMAGTPNLDWFVRECCLEDKREAKKGGKDFYALLEGKISKIPVGSEGIIYHPYLNPGGERAPFVKPSARAQFFGISLEHNRGHLLRAVYEGVALSMLDCFNHIPVEIQEIRLTGGGAESKLWCGIFADATGKTIKTFRGTELGAMGAALTAGVAVGIYPNLIEAVEKTVRVEKEYPPNFLHHRKYLQIYELYRQMREHLWEDWDLREKIIS